MVNKIEDNVFTLHTSLIPFVEHNDGARMQMASSQIRQQLQYEDPDIPIVMTGFEDYVLDLYRWKLDEEGVVEYKDNFLIVIKTDSGKVYNIYVHPTDEIVVDVGQRVTKETLLTVPKGFVKKYSVDGDGEYYLAYGKNMLTAILNSSYGYEDAYYISEKAKEKLKGYIPDTIEIILSPSEELTLLDTGDFLHEPGTVVKKGQVLASIRNKYTDKIVNYFASYNYVVDDVIVIVNRDKMLFDFDPKYRAFLSKFLLDKIKYSQLYPVVANTYGLYAKNITNNDKREWSIVVKYYLRQIVEADLGNKITNRHAGKGVISKIDNDEVLGYCPEFNDYCDLYLSPMSIISRMNVGTFFEMLATKASFFLVKNIEKMISDGKSLDDIKKVIEEFYDELYSETSIRNEIKDVVRQTLDKIDTIDKLRKFIPFIYAPPMNSPSLHKLLTILEKYQLEPIYLVRSLITTDNEDIFNIYTEEVNVTDENRQTVVDSISKIFGIPKEYAEELISKEKVLKLHPSMTILSVKRDNMIYNYIAFTSYLYYQALVHISENKLTARSVGRLSKKYLTPERRDDRKDTGQRVGEMESLCLLSHGAESILYEFMTAYSDDIYRKTDLIFSELYGIPVTESSGLSESGTVHILNAYLKFLSGIELQDITNLLTENDDGNTLPIVVQRQEQDRDDDSSMVSTTDFEISIRENIGDNDTISE